MERKHTRQGFVRSKEGQAAVYSKEPQGRILERPGRNPRGLTRVRFTERLQSIEQVVRNHLLHFDKVEHRGMFDLSQGWKMKDTEAGDKNSLMCLESETHKDGRWEP